jgi:ribosomal protein S18 acetylase RimI-like enzyme
MDSKDVKFLTINGYTNRIGLVSEFWDNLKLGRSSFRYFSKRPINIVNNHLFCCVIIDAEDIVAYGHLDPDEDRVWLGVAVSDNYVGKGFGSAMVEKLVDVAVKKNLRAIYLAVDLDNLAAKKIYVKMGFIELPDESTDSFYKMRLSLSQNL